MKYAIGAVIAALALAPAADAATKQKAAKLTVKTVGKPPASVATGGTFKLAVRVANAKHRRSAAGRVTVTLRPGAGGKIALAGGNLKITKGGQTRTVTLSIAVAKTVKPGTYTLVACVRRAGLKGHCRTAGKITIIVVPPPVPQPQPQPTPVAVSPDALKAAITAPALRGHLQDLQESARIGGGNRASGMEGFGATSRQLVNTLRAAGYNPTVQSFDFPFFQQLSPSTLARTSAPQRTYVEDEDFATMSFSGSGNTEKPVTPVDLKLGVGNASTSGCEAADFAGFPAGNIALVQRGTCAFGDKVKNAQAAGASGAIVMNQGNTTGADRNDLFAGTLGGPVKIPAVSVSYAEGVGLSTGNPVVHLTTDTLNEVRTTANIIAETAGGNPDKVVLVGSHLDSVPEGPGINDNGTGSAFNLELALQLAKMKAPVNKVRFAWWGAEEEGLLGSTHYVSEISDADFEKIMLNLNFDMLGSPNHAVLVYDGDFSDTTPPATAPTVNPGAKEIEQQFNAYFTANGIPFEPTGFDGRSDYKAFQDNGKPAGGLFTGAEVPKTAAQAAKWGGLPNVAFDANYHAAGDDINNVDLAAYEKMAKAAAYVTGIYATRTLNPSGGASATKSKSAARAEGTHYLGDKLTRLASAERRGG